MVGSLSDLPVCAPVTLLEIKLPRGLHSQEVSSALCPGMWSHEDVILPQEASQRLGTPSCWAVLRANVEATGNVRLRVLEAPSVLADKKLCSLLCGQGQGLQSPWALEGTFLISFSS